MSLYLRYHPKTLDAVVGHDATVTTMLRQYITLDNLHL